MTQSGLGRSWPLWIGRAGSWGPPSHYHWNKSQELRREDTHSRSCVHPCVDRPLVLSCNSSLQRGIMGLGKSSPFLAFSILVLCQAGSLHAAPLRSALESLPRSALESLPDPLVLSEKEGRLLLAALVQAYVQRKANELVEQEEQEQEQEAEDSSLDSSRAKRCSNLSTCVLGTYLKYLNNFHTFSGIGFGAETPGKIRDIANILEKDHYPNVGVSQNYNVTAQKRACNTATCVTHRLAGLLSRSGGVVKSNFVPTNVGSDAFGRRRRDLQA